MGGKFSLRHRHTKLLSDMNTGSSGTIKLAKKTAAEKPAADKKPAAVKVCTKAQC